MLQGFYKQDYITSNVLNHRQNKKKLKTFIVVSHVEIIVVGRFDGWRVFSIQERGKVFRENDHT